MAGCALIEELSHPVGDDDLPGIRRRLDIDHSCGDGTCQEQLPAYLTDSEEFQTSRVDPNRHT